MTNTAFAVINAILMIPVSFMAVKLYMDLSSLARNRRH
jgi:hypothetical protein